MAHRRLLVAERRQSRHGGAAAVDLTGEGGARGLRSAVMPAIPAPPCLPVTHANRS
ncbi:hypothetical protein BVI434_2620002 [Burkholderia vietnamiensis]|nr:hypothetical protein BVI434_2620002 [Burkholderia vietnamiensis]CAG9215223.1 hypothetical protein BVI1335_2650001 [Burkholderia vietnamiensis]CAG9220205.1 hypothetical protein BVI2075_760005 [Burkholderia vietnamiensis]